jgi:hypothetical protein
VYYILYMLVMLWVNFEEVKVGFPCVTWFASVLGEQSGNKSAT